MPIEMPIVLTTTISLDLSEGKSELWHKMIQHWRHITLSTHHHVWRVAAKPLFANRSGKRCAVVFRETSDGHWFPLQMPEPFRVSAQKPRPASRCDCKARNASHWDHSYQFPKLQPSETKLVVAVGSKACIVGASACPLACEENLH
ncbi:hypothetical protein MPLB_1820030 [Mesorhizobium sp. ORS 3324]|nr:hypothetical protein MPLB_1820030 [Mesorhizobium sp. ORS 3324]